MVPSGAHSPQQRPTARSSAVVPEGARTPEGTPAGPQPSYPQGRRGEFRPSHTTTPTAPMAPAPKRSPVGTGGGVTRATRFALGAVVSLRAALTAFRSSRTAHPIPRGRTGPHRPRKCVGARPPRRYPHGCCWWPVPSARCDTALPAETANPESVCGRDPPPRPTMRGYRAGQGTHGQRSPPRARAHAHSPLAALQPPRGARCGQAPRQTQQQRDGAPRQSQPGGTVTTNGRVP